MDPTWRATRPRPMDKRSASIRRPMRPATRTVEGNSMLALQLDCPGYVYDLLRRTIYAQVRRRCADRRVLTAIVSLWLALFDAAGKAVEGGGAGTVHAQRMAFTK